MQRDDFVAIFTAMGGLPVTVRLLDPPLHEFLPDITELSVRVAVAEAKGEENENDLRLLQAVHKMHEANPMLGLRGVRLGLVIPGLFMMQVRAIAEAAAQVAKAGGVARVEIMVPLVGAVQELEIIRDEAQQVLDEVRERTGADIRGADRHHDRAAARGPDRRPDRRGRAVLLLRHQRPDADHVGLLPRRRRGRVLLGLPGPRHLRRVARSRPWTARASASWCGSPPRRAARPARTLKLGVCGEHGGDPDSVHFFHQVGLDYVSCSPFRVPVARLEAARAAIESAGSDSR